MRVCTKCKLPKDESEFYKAREYKGKIYLTSRCKTCLDEISIAYNTKNRKGNKIYRQKENDYRKKRILTDEEYHKRLKERKRESHKRNIVHNLWKRTKDRAVRRGIDFELEESDIIIPTVCPILEIPIFCGDKTNYGNSPTIDRRNNSKGYTKENSRIISMLANTMKNAASKEHIETFCKNILNYIK